MENYDLADVNQNLARIVTVMDRHTLVKVQLRERNFISNEEENRLVIHVLDTMVLILK